MKKANDDGRAICEIIDKPKKEIRFRSTEHLPGQPFAFRSPWWQNEKSPCHGVTVRAAPSRHSAPRTQK